METLVVVAQHRNQFHRSKTQGHARFGTSSPSRDFRGINCRTFQTGTGILPTPWKPDNASPVPKMASPSSPSPRTPSTTVSDNKPRSKIATPKSAPVAIKGKPCGKVVDFSEGHHFPGGRCISLSELWAGPTYSNSPPPSSLPIPKFSVRPKRTVSLDLPRSSPEIELHQVAKSAPSSPRREHTPSTRDIFANADSATKTLCRILNLNLDGE
ncbi:hypothetical protein PIB30_031898 [Stylosanthes scabra]|uniref:Uncharacterized protein n=1 Tax=Stylosanthes scabra TaxID=79078 RepID=A0ABU6XDX1_9FABA|nr:hypothetical protein [Stylosanthes scabra]